MVVEAGSVTVRESAKERDGNRGRQRLPEVPLYADKAAFIQRFEESLLAPFSDRSSHSPKL